MADGQNTAAATIETLTKQFSDAFRARDFATLGNMFTNDAVVCPPNSNMVTGKGNIQSYWERNGFIQDLRFDSVSVKPLGEIATRVVGTLTMQVRFNQQGGNALANARPQSREINAKYIFVWQKVGDDWKIESCIWNRIGPERGNFPMPAAIRRLPQNNPGGGMGQGPGGGMGQGPGGGMGQGGGPRGGGMGPGGGPRGGGMGPGGGPRGGGMGPGGGPRGGGMGPGGGPRGGGMGPGGGPRGGGMGPGGGPRGGGMGPGGRRDEGGSEGE